MKDQIFKISCMSNASRVESVNSDRCNNLYFFPIFCIPFKWLAEQAIDTCVSLGLQMRSPVVISLHTYDHLVPFISVGVTRISRQEFTWGRCFKLYTWYSKISLENQKIHHFESTKFPIVGKPLDNAKKIQKFEVNFGFPKIFSNTTFPNWILSHERDETLKKKMLDSHFHFRSEF